ncbi:MAG: fluoride exporter [Frankiaceae bacterium]|nr:fluoride exporter [Frankiaceae bacterium]MDQ1726493.1 fluoride exporter [Frankiaceae bacterium]
MAGGDRHPELALDPDFDRGPEHLRPASIALVALGGIAGTATRYALGRTVHPVHGWPLGTLLANLAGAFLLGVLLEGLARSGGDGGARRRWRLLGGIGFCGAFTTYSSLAVEVTGLLRDSHPAAAAGYAFATLVAGFLLTLLGVASATRIVRARQ